MTRFESYRQLFHILFGGLLLALALFLGPQRTKLFFASSFLLGILILQLKMSGVPLPGVDYVLKHFERKNALFPGQGAMMFFAGAFLAFLFTPFPVALAVIAIVSFGDGFATLVGMRGKHALFWNKEKTWEGFLAFLFSATAMASFALSVPVAAFYSLVLAAVETAPVKTDDNLLLPLAASAMYVLFGAGG